ncbi:MAG: hypothetical protein RXS23_05840 [Metallosphaera yellowstonensis]|jgi:hypothetical protein
MRYPLTSLYYLSVILISAVPLPWWFYSVGGIVSVSDSPFQVLIYFMGDRLLLSDVITFLLTGFRIYVIFVAIGYLLETMRGNPKIYSTMFWFPVLYVLDPVIIYVVFLFLPKLLGFPANYPLLIWGEETFTSSYMGNQIRAEVMSYPTIMYWAALASAVLYIPSRLEMRKNRKVMK